MPVNAPAEFFKAQERYLKAKSLEEKIDALEEMIRTLPKHKGTENLHAQLRAKLSKLRDHAERERKGKKQHGIRKEGDVMVAVVGFANSGKTRFINMLAGTEFEESPHEFSTHEPLTAMVDFGGAKIQLVEIPAFFRRQHMSIVHACECLVIVARNEHEVRELKKILSAHRIEKPCVMFTWNAEREEVVKSIWNECGVIRVYTKERDKKPADRPIVVKRGATIRDVAKRIHMDFVKHFRFARVWGKSAKYPGEKVGLEHVLEDGDVVEIRTK